MTQSVYGASKLGGGALGPAAVPVVNHVGDDQQDTAHDYDEWMKQDSVSASWVRFWFSPKRTLWLNTPARTLAARLALRPADRVLDVGCGYAGLLIYLHRKIRFTGTVDGIDCSARMVERAREEVRSRGMQAHVEIRQGLATALPYPDASVDVVLCTYVVKHLSDESLRTLLREVRRVLKPGGRFCLWEAAPSRYAFMQAWNLKLLRLGVSVVYLRTAAELRVFLEEAGFTDLQPYGHGLYYFYPPLPRAGYIATSPAAVGTDT